MTMNPHPKAHRPLPLLQAADGSSKSEPLLQRPSPLTAQWVVIDGKLLCQWRAQ
ncbi:hypothetical protein XM38_028000 [Halomicronema hongdechloris C2206]|uniref:Uncharacterized protein n=1 Tax=Halomicronema hongdechloris C2206 TaxID=1641165 RepID=A0A1Z3HNJ8_9CYAN|nr:hypothetical protein [Halomicronema hongdechloris]ASC71846.1 hypothetical protein XM38_028000 [Halomicronema hongdechloris C2206]